MKHADETGWRTDGNSGYAWIFCSNDTTIFQFKNTRGSSVARAIFGEEELFGVLVVDRYAGYNKIKCKNKNKQIIDQSNLKFINLGFKKKIKKDSTLSKNKNK